VTLDHCVIAVSDWERSNAFYADVIGAEVVARGAGFAYRLRAPHGAEGFPDGTLGDQQLNVHGPGVNPDPVARDRVRPGNSDLCFRWDGPIEGAISHLEAHGIEIELGPVERHGALGAGTSVYFRDPDGSLVEFITYAPR
jgi:catechol 2,3-dioxygenase-like lactoylglutathione lyase family enzyme